MTPPDMLSAHRSSWLAISLLVFVAMFALACGSSGKSTKPPNQKTVLLSSEYADSKAGEESAKAVAAEMGIIESPELQAYIDAVGKRLAPYAPHRSFKYSFAIVDQVAPNAFALPGGYIFISRGLLALSNSEDELACVIGHEITHSAERHAAGRQGKEQRMNPLSMGYMRAKTIASYGQQQEHDADRGGQIMAAQAGYDPQGMTQFLSDLGRVERLEVGVSRLPSFFATHPTTPERVGTTAQRAQNLSYPRKPAFAPTRSHYLRVLDGIVVGPNPAEGIFVDTRFFHPDLDFTLRFPEGWVPVNTHQAVGAVHPRGEARAVLMVPGPGEDPKEAAGRFLAKDAEEMNAKVVRAQSVDLGGLPAYRIDAEAKGPQGHLSLQVTWIAYKGLIYEITVMAPSRLADKHLPRGNAITRSFRPLTVEERNGIGIARLRIVRAKAGETLPQLTARTGNAWDPNMTAVYNDIPVTRALEEGTLVKIAVLEPYRGSPKPLVQTGE